MSITKDLDEFNIFFNKKLEEKLDLIKDIPENLFEAIKYIIFSGGKRIRPFLMVEVFKLYSKDIDRMLDFAMAVEMIHTYSLVHDDLPAMDNDDYRRGKLTVHKKYGEDIAVLTGDGLLNLAFELVGENLKTCISIQDFKQATWALSEISKYSGVRGMIAGQVLDMEIEKNNKTIDIVNMYELKTAGLFKAATVTGGILGSASGEDISILRDFGKNLGLAYQIQDDILDKEEDLKINKITLSTKSGLLESQKKAKEYTEKSLTCLEELKDRDTLKLEKLTKLLMGREL